MNRARKMDERAYYAPTTPEPRQSAFHNAVEQTLQQLEDSLRTKREVRANVSRLLRRLNHTNEG